MMFCGIQRTCGELLLHLLGIGLSNGAIIALNAIGITLVYGAVRTINFAYGDVFALTTVLITTLIGSLGLHWGMPLPWLIGGLILVFIAAAALAVLLNVAIERVAFKPFRGTSRLAPLLATIGISFIFYQVALIWRHIQLNGQVVHKSDVNNVANIPLGGIPELVPKINLVQAAGLDMRITYTIKDLVVLLLACSLAGVVFWLINFTRIGRAIRACAQDPEMAQLCGINRNYIARLTFAIGGVLAAASAFVFTFYYNRPLGQHGVDSGLTAFAAAVLGGIGNPFGAFVSGLVFGVFSAFSDYFIDGRWTPVLLLMLLIALLVLRPGGLLGNAQDDAPEEGAILWASRRPRQTSITWPSIALLALALLYPLLERLLGFSEQTIITQLVLFALLALGLNIVLGFAGLLDLGYAALFAIGGYTAAILASRSGPFSGIVPTHLDILAVLAISGAVAGLFGVINGLLTLRLRGEYLAIVTLAFGQMAPRLFLNLDSITGGARGMSAVPPPHLFGFTLSTPIARYYLAVGMLLLVVLISHRLLFSRIGRAWAAMSADEQAAASNGINIGQSRMLAFTLGAIIAGMGGALFATVFSYVDSGQSDFTISAMVLAMVIIGGAGNIRGTIIGALAIAGYNQLGITRFGAWLVETGQEIGGLSGQLLASLDPRSLSYMFFGLALYLIVLWRARETSAVKPTATTLPLPTNQMPVSDQP